MNTFILVNGPPRSGKDTFGKALAERFENVLVVKFATILKYMAHAIYGINYTASEHFDAVKDVPASEFFGRTPRDVYKAVSEKLMKPLHGPRIFGKLLADKLENEDLWGSQEKILVVTDSGFRDEALELIDRFHDDAQFILVRLNRGEEYNFANDSRSYIDLPGITTIDLDSSGTIEEFKQRVVNVIGALPCFKGAGVRSTAAVQAHVQIPGGSGEPVWYPISDASGLDDAFLARVETIRRKKYQSRVIRIVVPGSTSYFFPGDPPIYDFTVESSILMEVDLTGGLDQGTMEENRDDSGAAVN